MAGLFDIVGPVMVGPSSSHTAGAVRIGLLARAIANAPIAHAELTLYNSFAQTYKGHGTDKGLIAGLLGFGVADSRIRDAETHAQAEGLGISFVIDTSANHFPPNTVSILMTLADSSTCTVVGHSLGGGKVLVSKINQYSVSLKGEQPTLLLFYKDQPRMIAQVASRIGDAGINIATLQCVRLKRDIEATMVITLDDPLPANALASVALIDGVFWVRHLAALPA